MVKYLKFTALIFVVLLSLVISCKKENEIKKEVFEDPNTVKVKEAAVRINTSLDKTYRERYEQVLKKLNETDTRIKAGGPPPPGGGPQGTPESSFKYPAVWPAGLKAYKNSIITTATSSNTDARLIYVSEAEPEEIEKFIASNMQANGYKVSVKTPGKFVSIWEYTKNNAYMRYIIKLDPTHKMVEVDATWVNNQN